MGPEVPHELHNTIVDIFTSPVFFLEVAFSLKKIKLSMRLYSKSLLSLLLL
jgi:hypothetical protein